MYATAALSVPASSLAQVANGAGDTKARYVMAMLDSFHDDDSDPAHHAPALRIVEAVQSRDASQRDLHDAVAAARTAGMSWSAIGATLGISRQAAWERFGTQE